MVGALRLDAAEAETFRREPAGEPVAPRAPGPAEIPVLFEVEAERSALRIELERGEAERREVRRVVDLDHGPRRPVHQVDRQQEVLAGGVQHREIALEPHKDALEHLERSGHRPDERRVPPRLCDPFETDMALLAQPVERPALQNDPVLRRRGREGRVDAAGRHGAIVASKRWQPRGWR